MIESTLYFKYIVYVQVKQGEILGLLVPSGAGKPTLLKIITGQLKATEGKSEVLGISSGLDPTTAKTIHELILMLRDEGATVFLTTHNMEEATKLCDHVALLFEGNIILRTHRY